MFKFSNGSSVRPVSKENESLETAEIVLFGLTWSDYAILTGQVYILVTIFEESVFWVQGGSAGHISLDKELLIVGVDKLALSRWLIVELTVSIGDSSY